MLSCFVKDVFLMRDIRCLLSVLYLSVFGFSLAKAHDVAFYSLQSCSSGLRGGNNRKKKVESRETREHIAPSSHSAMRIM